MEEQTHPQTKREYLAQSIAHTFGDSDREHLYLQSCKKYSLSLVYRAFAEAKSYPPERIRKSRAALFFYLLKQYSHDRKQNIGN